MSDPLDIDSTTGNQSLTGRQVMGGLGGVAHLPSFHEALTRWETCKSQTEESRLLFLECKNSGTSSSMFTAAVVLAEAFCSAEEAREVFEGIVEEENWKSIQAERAERTERLLERRG